MFELRCKIALQYLSIASIIAGQLQYINDPLEYVAAYADMVLYTERFSYWVQQAELEL